MPDRINPQNPRNSPPGPGCEASQAKAGARRVDRMRRAATRLALMIAVLLALNTAADQPAPDPQADREARRAAARERMLELFDPPVNRLPGESRAVPGQAIDALTRSPAQAARVKRWLARQGIAVFNMNRPGLTLHYYAQGIEKMTPIDLVWEGMPRRADSLQALIDQVITKARKTGQPIRHLIIAGHAGLPGCSAFGGELIDCTFEGKLTHYHRRQLTRLRPYLAKDTELELRQCVTGSGPQGERLLRAIHQTTGAKASSYLADFHFGDSAKHPRVLFDGKRLRVIEPQ